MTNEAYSFLNTVQVDMVRNLWYNIEYYIYLNVIEAVTLVKEEEEDE